MPDRVVILHDFSEALGGASHLVQVLIAQLRARSVPVTFIAGDAGANFIRKDVEFVALGGKALLQQPRLEALTKGLHNPLVARRVREWITANDTPRTVYHLHGWAQTLSPAVFAALRPVAARLILHGHDYFNTCPNGAFFDFRRERACSRAPLGRECLVTQCDKSSGLFKAWRSGRERLRRHWLGGVDWANRALLIHPRQDRLFRQGGWSPEKLFAVRNPVSPPCSVRVEVERCAGVVFVGRISREKGADLAALAARAAGVAITFVGDGAECARVRALNPDARFLGRLDRKGVAQALQEARVAVMPSRWAEPFGLVAFEAIGSGVPVIVDRKSLVGAEIAGAGFGLALDTGDIAAFAAAIARLHADDSLARSFSEAGFSRYRELCHSEDSWAEAILGHYREVAFQDACSA
ncbi:glycosyltransferase family 4 protein [Novosphingobium profundi]|uniref:glycosyltransferase family 4 protein n=1 Tax=Novosphingobium profundi TaxID=1774954 RepID=UPI001BD991CF|nr:glycosyltransferase family 4 protein [Novosphingobium profundi]MBT0666980.1 glycosyltransferase family 4 protein [Novosphingobium profundi]